MSRRAIIMKLVIIIQFDDSFAEKVVRFLMCEELVVYIVTLHRVLKADWNYYAKRSKGIEMLKIILP